MGGYIRRCSNCDCTTVIDGICQYCDTVVPPITRETAIAFVLRSRRVLETGEDEGGCTTDFGDEGNRIEEALDIIDELLLLNVSSQPDTSLSSQEVPMKIRPIHDYVLVQPKKADAVSKGGIILPDNNRENNQQGEVLAVGPGRILDSGERIAPEVVAGDVVIYNRRSSAAAKSSIEEPDGPVLIRESDILAVLDINVSF